MLDKITHIRKSGSAGWIPDNAAIENPDRTIINAGEARYPTRYSGKYRISKI